MRLTSPFLTLSCLLVLGGQGHAQAPTPAPSEAPAAADGDDAEAAEAEAGDSGTDAEEDAEGDDAPAPAPEPDDDAVAGEPAAPSEEAGEPGSPAPVPSPPATSATPDLGISPDALEDAVDGVQLEDAFDAPDTYTAPTPVFTLHGYMRTRLELMDGFWLGRDIPEDDWAEPDPFTRFRAIERRSPGTACPEEGKLSEGPEGEEQRFCDIDTVRFANMRLRLSPQLTLTEDVRVKTTFDVFDNVVLGSQPDSFYGTGIAGSQFEGTFADTSRGGTIIARRAWAEVRNRDLGEIRFGRMPQEWGLGMLYNAGNGLDHDFSTDVDRLLILTKLAGLYFSVSYDFLAEGAIGRPAAESRPALDLSQIDDSDQWTFSVSRHFDDEARRGMVERGDVVLEGGLQLRMRDQQAYANGDGSPPATDDLLAIKSTHYTPDLWATMRYRGIRLGLEAAWVIGSMRYVFPNSAAGAGGGDSEELDISQFGAVLESEFRFVENRLGVHFHSGVASGDADVEGLSSDADLIAPERNRTVSTFRFHPSYQVDMILWRNIMRQVTGAYYFKPGISYDFVRDEFGQLFGARLDGIWSRATSFVQAPGNDADLAVELNAQLYWISDDGADPSDGYNASLQYGVLFPLQGLGYADEKSSNLDLAQHLRLVLGVTF